MKLIWHGHACYSLVTKEGTVVFDPYEPGYVPGLTLPELEADLVLCSHGHRDHGCAGAVKLSGRAVSLHHSSIPSFHDEAGGAKRGENSILVVDAEGKRIVHLGDLGHPLSREQLDQLGKVDVLLIPVGGFYTIDADTAFEIAGRLKPRITIPMHYRGEGFGYDVLTGVEDYARLAADAEYPDTNELEIPDSGEGRTIILRCPVG